ncbi:MAG TPA: hypothetical protein PKG73_03580 [bacterium]|nr:hypothetical protein [bacterium]HOH67453.1 hypothetical protein [bacterium]
MQKILLIAVMMVVVFVLTGCPPTETPTPEPLQRFQNESRLLTSQGEELGNVQFDLSDWTKYQVIPQSQTLWVDIGARDQDGQTAQVEWVEATIDYQMMAGAWGGQALSYHYTNDGDNSNDDDIIATNTFLGVIGFPWYWYPVPFRHGTPYWNYPWPAYDYWQVLAKSAKEKTQIVGDQWLKIVPDQEQERITATVEFRASNGLGEENKKFSFLIEIDSDGDSYPNWEETQAGTDPFDPESHPGIVPEDPTSIDGPVTISFVASQEERSIYVDLHQITLDNAFIGMPNSDEWVAIGVQVCSAEGQACAEETFEFERGKPNVVNLAPMIPTGAQEICVRLFALNLEYPNFGELDGRYWFEVDGQDVVTLNNEPLAEATGAQGQGLGCWRIPLVEPEVRYTLTAGIEPAGSGTVAGTGSYLSGETVEVKATPATGWEFSHWTGDLAGSANPATVVMDSDKTITAVFTELPVYYTLTVEVIGEGSVIKNPDKTLYPAGEAVTLTAQADEGWGFDHWTGDLAGTDNPSVITMDGNKEVDAAFSQEPPEEEGEIIVDLTWANGTLGFTARLGNGYPANGFSGVATEAQIQTVGLELYHLAGGAPWIERDTFTFNGWPVNGTITKFRFADSPVLRFEVVANAINGYGDISKLVVRLNGELVPRVTNPEGQTAFQIELE